MVYGPYHRTFPLPDYFHRSIYMIMRNAFISYCSLLACLTVRLPGWLQIPPLVDAFLNSGSGWVRVSSIQRPFQYSTITGQQRFDGPEKSWESFCEEEDDIEGEDSANGVEKEPELCYLSVEDWEREEAVRHLEAEMGAAAADGLFEVAARWRDTLSRLQLDDAGAVLRCHQEFYAAFGRRDLRRLQALWLPDPRALVAHPFEPPAAGYANVGRYWARLLGDRPDGRPPRQWKEVALADLRVAVRGTTAWVTCTERLSNGGGGGGGSGGPAAAAASASASASPPREVYATNVFARRGGRWRLLVRVVSPDTLDPVVGPGPPAGSHSRERTHQPNEEQGKTLIGDDRDQDRKDNNAFLIRFDDDSDSGDERKSDDEAEENSGLNIIRSLDGKPVALADFLKDIGVAHVDELEAVDNQRKTISLDEQDSDRIAEVVDSLAEDRELRLELGEDGALTVTSLLPPLPPPAERGGGEVDDVVASSTDEEIVEFDYPEDMDADEEKEFFNIFSKLGLSLPPPSQSKTEMKGGKSDTSKSTADAADSANSQDDTVGQEDELVPDFNNGKGKDLMRQTVEGLQRLWREGRLSSQDKKVLITDVIQQAATEEAALVERAYQLLVLESELGWADKGIVEEFASQAALLANSLDCTDKEEVSPEKEEGEYQGDGMNSQADSEETDSSNDDER